MENKLNARFDEEELEIELSLIGQLSTLPTLIKKTIMEMSDPEGDLYLPGYLGPLMDCLSNRAGICTIANLIELRYLAFELILKSINRGHAHRKNHLIAFDQSITAVLFRDDDPVIRNLLCCCISQHSNPQIGP